MKYERTACWCMVALVAILAWWTKPEDKQAPHECVESAPKWERCDCDRFPAALQMGEVQIRFRDTGSRDLFSYGAIMWTQEQWQMFSHGRWDLYKAQRDSLQDVGPVMSKDEWDWLVNAIERADNENPTD